MKPPTILKFNAESLTTLEAMYRELAANPSVISPGLSLDMLERLLALFLGEVLLQQYEGEWGAYTGRYRVLSPVLPRIGTDRNAGDVFVFT